MTVLEGYAALAIALATVILTFALLVRWAQR